MGSKEGIVAVLDMERPLFCQLVRQVVKLRAEQLEDCFALQQRLGGRLSLGQILLSQGLVTREQIAKVLQLQARWVANAMQEVVRPADAVARIGGDGFAVLRPGAGLLCCSSGGISTE